ncbi:MAG TPA: AAA family ATPase [Verrucomicrobiae bacterium]|nr:AAA family ATPase [Verrucomicrobiae bacterium]
MPLRIALLAQPRVLSADGTREYPLPRKTLNVLAYLILHRKRPSARDSVAFALFPDDDEDVARGHLRRNLSYLLSSLPATPEDSRFVLVDNERVAWNEAAAARVDAIEFDRAIAEGRDEDAVAEYEGDLLPTLYDDWTTAERERLRDAFHEALTSVIARDRSLRRFERATAMAHRLLDEDPWREDIVRELMAIRYEAGDRAGALAAFERFAARMRDEMNAEPMAETYSVRDTLLRGARLPTSEPAAKSLDLETAPLGALPFVGRGASMETALTRWHAAADGRAQVIFVCGEAGIGKSRFCAEFGRAVEREGGIVVRGETSAGGEHRPYEAFVEALRSAAFAIARRSKRREADVWDRVLEELLDEHAGATFADDRSARVRLFDSVRRGLIDLARSRPAVLILEDLHWAGSATIDLLEFVATRLGHVPLLIVVSFRNNEMPQAHPLRALRRQLEGRGNATPIILDPLEQSEALAAARSAAPLTLDDATLAKAVGWSEGVPLLLNEALRDLAAGRETGGGGIGAMLGARLSSLSSTAETALLYGAVLGARFELTALAAATGWRDDEVVEALGQSIELGLIRATARAPGLAFAFTHHLVRDASLERLPARERSAAHALVARALIALPGDGGWRAEQIARHLLAAGENGKAAAYFLTAARGALGVFANFEAREMATTGLALVEGGGEQKRLSYDLRDVRERALARIGALAERRADALAMYDLAGDDLELAAPALERIFDTHRDDPVVRGETLARLRALAPLSQRNDANYQRAHSASAFSEADYPAARDAALRAAELFEQVGDARAAFFARSQHLVTLYRLGDLKNVGENIEELRQKYQDSDDIELRMEFHRVASSVLTGQHPLDIGLDHARQSVELALRVGDRLAEGRARQNAAVYLGKMHEYERALREHELALDAYRDVGDAALVVNEILNVASVRGFCGDHLEAEALIAQISDEALQTPWIALVVAVNRAAFAMRSDRMNEAEAYLIVARDLASRLETALYGARIASRYGEFCALTGRNAEARKHLEEAISVLKLLAQPSYAVEALVVLARLCAGTGDLEAARAHAAEAADLAERFPIQHFAEYAWHLAATYALLDDDDAAKRFAGIAARAFVDAGMRMGADLVELYCALPWHRDTIAYLSGRSVPLRLSDSQRDS